MTPFIHFHWNPNAGAPVCGEPRRVKNLAMVLAPSFASLPQQTHPWWNDFIGEVMNWPPNAKLMQEDFNKIADKRGLDYPMVCTYLPPILMWVTPTSSTLITFRQEGEGFRVSLDFGRDSYNSASEILVRIAEAVVQ